MACDPVALAKLNQLRTYVLSDLSRLHFLLWSRTMSGKSVAWRTLMNAKTKMHKDGMEGYQPVSPFS